jgi:hypothetical protein
MDRCIVAITIALLSIMVLIMWGRIERFEEKISWTEDMILEIRKRG